jgi:glutaredoxin
MPYAIRTVLHRAITSPRGDSLAPVRIPKDLARRLNAALGSPLAPGDELAKREAARARLAELRAQGGKGERLRRDAAPVLVYCEKDRNVRELGRIEELLASKGYAFKRLDVANDEATIEFVMLQAHCKRDELPVVFVADRAIGGYEALVRSDVSGEFARLVRPS